jgi:Arc/MetJ-type ribon-helix-helix transcriptional regulator
LASVVVVVIPSGVEETIVASLPTCNVSTSPLGSVVQPAGGDSYGKTQSDNPARARRCLDDPCICTQDEKEVAVVSNAAKTIELPEDLQAFAEERVRTGKSASIADVVRDALEEKKRSLLREALDAGIAELDTGRGVESSPDGLMAEVYADVGIDR